jgi:uncharacterized protein YndB with AHSA1/START domain
MEREVVLARIFSAPRELVFKAWTDPSHTRQWWGPRYWTNPVCEMDVRVGGGWRIVMRSPDGGDYPCGGVYVEIAPPERLVFTNIAMDLDGNHSAEGVTTVVLTEHAGQTELTLITRMVGLAPFAPRMLAGMEAGWTQSLERLTGHVEGGAPEREIVVTRLVDAPRELVFAAWTDAGNISRWWGPRGFTTTTYEMDVRPGGRWRHTMHGPDGTDYENHVVYREVAPPERIVYDHVSDPVFQSIVTFDELDGRTKLTLRMVFEAAKERAWVVEKHGAIEGAEQTLARLGELLHRS